MSSCPVAEQARCEIMGLNLNSLCPIDVLKSVNSPTEEDQTKMTGCQDQAGCQQWISDGSHDAHEGVLCELR